jgi:hypothetical protein
VRLKNFVRFVVPIQIVAETAFGCGCGVLVVVSLVALDCQDGYYRLMWRHLSESSVVAEEASQWDEGTASGL